jgi:hypothetical protein
MVEEGSGMPETHRSERTAEKPVKRVLPEAEEAAPEPVGPALWSGPRQGQKALLIEVSEVDGEPVEHPVPVLSWTVG